MEVAQERFKEQYGAHRGFVSTEAGGLDRESPEGRVGKDVWEPSSRNNRRARPCLVIDERALQSVVLSVPRTEEHSWNGDRDGFPADSEGVVRYENRCACMDTGGCGCLVPAVEGSVYCASCWDRGCDCRCPQRRTSACTGVANGCECGCCQHDRRGGRYAPASKALVKKEPEKKEESSRGSGACSMGGSLSESSLCVVFVLVVTVLCFKKI